MKALVFGGTGQDGHYLIEHLIELGHEVVATHHRLAAVAEAETRPQVCWLPADLRDGDAVTRAVVHARPDVVFNVAALTTPGARWGEVPRSGGDGDAEVGRSMTVADVNAMGTLRILHAVEREAPTARVVHASSSAVYAPRRYGMYGASKQFAHEVIVGFRRRGLWASNAVLYSHTSPRQDQRFLIPRMCAAAVRVAAGSDERFVLVDPWGERDWMSARDAVCALVRITCADVPGDFDVASGQPRRPAHVLRHALHAAGAGRVASQVMVDGGGDGFEERGADLEPLRRLGWRPMASLDEVLTEMVAEIRQESGS